MHQNLTHPFSHKIELPPHLRITAKSQGTPDKITSAPQNGEIACRAFRDFVSLAERKQQLCCSQRCDFPRKNRPPIGCCRAPHPGHLQTLILCASMFFAKKQLAAPAPATFFVRKREWLSQRCNHYVSGFSKREKPAAFFLPEARQARIAHFWAHQIRTESAPKSHRCRNRR